jgi:hypothetical protein
LIGFLLGTLIESRKENEHLSSVIQSLPYSMQAPALLQSHAGGVGLTSDGRQVVLSCGDLPDPWISNDHKTQLFRSVKPSYRAVLMLPDTLCFLDKVLIKLRSHGLGSYGNQAVILQDWGRLEEARKEFAEARTIYQELRQRRFRTVLA